MIRRLVPMLAALAVTLAAGAAAAAPQAWIAAWGASPQAPEPNSDDALLKLDGQTVRQRLRVSAGGDQLRIRLSNEFGLAPLTVGAATVALPSDPAGVQPGSIRPLTFGGRSTVTIPAGAPILSDPVTLPLAAGTEISISLYFPQKVASPTLHSLALKRAVVSAPGDFTGAAHIEAQLTSEASILVSAVLVRPSRPHHVLVALGDSITDGAASTVEADRNWPSDLVRRLAQTRPRGPALAVVNAGISGNRLLRDGYGSSALARFDRDVLALPGVTHVVVMEGLNDIGSPGAKLGGRYLADPTDAPTPQALIDGYRQLIDRAHAHGIKVIGATLTPFEGTTLPGYYSETKEAARQAVNDWIRTGGHFDGMIDFDAALRDPARPARLQARYAARDHLHPNDAGYQAMVDAIDLALFR